MSAPSTCTLSGKVYQDGALATTPALVRIRLIGASDIGGTPTGDGQSTGAARSVYTAAGIWSIVVPQGVTFRIEIPLAGLDVVGTVPDASTADVSDLSTEDYLTWHPRHPESPL